MPDEPLISGVAEWTRAVELDRLQASRPIATASRSSNFYGHL